ncbi:MAG: hypothetical protein GY817_01565 [bacterium]|nr:hypothetical protein [bacterium]
MVILINVIIMCIILLICFVYIYNARGKILNFLFSNDLKEYKSELEVIKETQRSQYQKELSNVDIFIKKRNIIYSELLRILKELDEYLSQYLIGFQGYISILHKFSRDKLWEHVQKDSKRNFLSLEDKKELYSLIEKTRNFIPLKEYDKNKIGSEATLILYEYKMRQIHEATNSIKEKIIKKIIEKSYLKRLAELNDAANDYFISNHLYLSYFLENKIEYILLKARHVSEDIELKLYNLDLDFEDRFIEKLIKNGIVDVKKQMCDEIQGNVPPIIREDEDDKRG